MHRNGTIITRSYMILGFGNDIDIIGIDRRAVEETYVPFKRDVGSEVVIGGDIFEVGEEFLYLGTLVTCDNDVTREIKRRIAAASRAFYGLRNQLKSRSLQTKTKLALYKTLILEVIRRAFGALNVKCCEQYSAVNWTMASGGDA